jgi:hypothetical protein
MPSHRERVATALTEQELCTEHDVDPITTVRDNGVGQRDASAGSPISVSMVVFFLLGYTFLAAIGAIVNSEQEAQQAHCPR